MLKTFNKYLHQSNLCKKFCYKCVGNTMTLHVVRYLAKHSPYAAAFLYNLHNIIIIIIIISYYTCSYKYASTQSLGSVWSVTVRLMRQHWTQDYWKIRTGFQPLCVFEHWCVFMWVTYSLQLDNVCNEVRADGFTERLHMNKQVLLFRVVSSRAMCV